MAPGEKTRRSAGIYSRSDQLLVYPYFKTTAGLSLAGEPVIVLGKSASDADLGTAVTESLQQHKTGLPHPGPSDFADLPQPILKAAKVKSWSTFSKGALSCSISEDTVELAVTPMRKGPTKSSFLFMPEREVVLPLPATTAQIGAAVREALARCE